jgi:hypothetical protein
MVRGSDLACDIASYLFKEFYTILQYKNYYAYDWLIAIRYNVLSL